MKFIRSIFPLPVFLLLAFLACRASLQAQGEANIWYFGQNAGLDFNGGPPVPLLNGQMVTQEGCATISDANGTLLFYTDGGTVWNANHLVMTNGTGLLGNFSSTQSAIIVPKPNAPGIYFIFTVPAGCSNTGVGLRFSEVDMSLSGGLGAVTTVKNVLLTTSTCEKVTATRHSNGVDYWVICHGPVTLINTYQVTSAGVNTTAVVSAAGTAATVAGYMKSSPDGTLVGRASSGVVEVMNFDASTGILTPFFSIPNSGLNYGIAFSQSGNMMYYSNAGFGAGIYQVDLTLGSAAAIVASNLFIGNSSPNVGYGMQLGPDGNIYVAEYLASFLSVINAPDSLGTACNFVAQGQWLGGGAFNGPGISRIGLPTFIQSFFLSPSFSVFDTCFSDTTMLTASSPQTDSIHWVFGDTASGPSNFGQGDTVFHEFTSTGTFQVTATSYFTNSTGLFGFVDSVFDTILVTIHPLPDIDLGNDTVLCQGDSLSILNSNTVLNMSYLWSDGSTGEFLAIAVADTYWVEVSTLCGVAYDTVVIEDVLPSMVNLGPDSILCVGDTLEFNIEVAQGNYLWQDLDTGSTYYATATGQYSVTATGLCNTSIDTVNLYFVAPPTTNFPPDTTFCNGQSFDLKSYGDSATFLWSDGGDDTTLIASSNDTFRVTSTNACGVFQDSVIITLDFPLSVALGPDTVLCVGSSYFLQANLLGENSYLWQDSTTLDSNLVAATGTYWLKATNTCGTYDDSIEVDYEIPPEISLPDNFLMCNGNAYRASVFFSRASYLWSTGSIDSSISIVSDGMYKVTATNLCGSDEDSIQAVFDFPLTIDIGDVFELCEGQSITLDASSPNDPEYTWNNSSQSPQYIITEQGFYSVTVTNTCGSYSDEVAVYVQRKPRAELPRDTALCEGEEWEVLLSQFYSNYQWQDGSKEYRYPISEPGTYLLSKSNSCGNKIDTMDVRYIAAPILNLGPDTFVCASIAPVELNAEAGAGVSYLWRDRTTDAGVLINEPGVYGVTLTEATIGCQSVDEIFIDECPVAIWIPSAFSPNKDLLNDVFLPRLSYVTEYELKIFNRWGEQIFTTINPMIGWDGTKQGVPVSDGMYVYMLKFKTEQTGVQKLKGSVSLLR